MNEFWETSFKEKQEMWGWEPAESANEAVELFRKQGIYTVLIPGIGYGRNAKIFVENGFKVSGIEISETAIKIAKNSFDNDIKIHHGSVNSMPFDHELYDGIFCYALIHLLNAEERLQLIENCYKQLKPNGVMVFVTISKEDFRYKQGKEISKDTFEPWKNLNLFFYDNSTIQNDFENFGLTNAHIISEEKENMGKTIAQKFWYIVCRK